jgi:hypothetical protein
MSGSHIHDFEPSCTGREVLAAALLAMTAYCIALPLFLYRALPDSNDILVHFFHARQFALALHEGFFPPRWVLDAYNGYGGPNFVFYGPLSYVFVAALRHFFLPIPAFITAIWFSFFLSGMTMFIAVKRIFGGGGFVAAFFYQVMPFHLFDLYERGGFAELFAFVWFPLIIYFAYVLKVRGGRKAFLGLSLSYAGLVMTHLVSAFIFTFIIGLYVVWSFLTGEQRRRPALMTLSLFLGLGLSSVYFLPAAFEQRFVHIDYITKCVVGDYKKNFLSLLNLPDLHGFQLWILIYTIMDVLLFLLIVLLLSGKKRFTGVREKNFFVLFFAAAFFFTIPLSAPLWAVIPGLPMIQFPWRWLSMVEVSLAFLLGATFSATEKPSFRSSDLKKRLTVYMLAVFVVAAFNIIINVKLFPSSYYDKVFSLREYTPIWVTDRKKILSDVRPEKVSAVAGSAYFRVTAWKSETRDISVDASAPAVLRIATFYYPGWKAGLDGGTIPIRVEKGTGAMLLDVPAGRHLVTLRFVDTPLRRTATIVSLISLFALAVVGILYGKGSSAAEDFSTKRSEW